MTSVKALSRVKLTVSGARGPIGIEIIGTPTDGQFLVKAPGGSRRFTTASGTGADAGLRTDIAASSGSSLIGSISGYIGAIARSIASRLNAQLPTLYDFGGDPTGSTDATSAIIKANGAGRVRLTPGVYLINQPGVVLTADVVIDPGALFVIPNDNSFAITGDIQAGDYRIFSLTGTGNVTGLRRLNVAWLAGHLLGTTTDATTLLNKIDGATVRNALVEFPMGSLCISNFIDFTKAQHVRGQGMWGASALLWLSAARNGIRFTGTPGGQLDNILIDAHSSQAAVVATSGAAVEFSGDAGITFTVQNVFVRAGFDAFKFHGGNTGFVSTCFAGDCINTGYWLLDQQNVRFTDCHASAFSDFADLSSTSGFISGESITWTGGNGAYGFTLSGTRAKIFINKTRPPNGTTITGQTSGATATVTSTTGGHQSGGLRIENHCEANDYTGCSFAGGVYAGYITAVTNEHGFRPEFGKMTSCYFDNSDNGIVVQYCASMVWANCWFASRAGTGITLMSAFDMEFSHCQFVNSWVHGLYADELCFHLRITGGAASGNNVSTTSSGDGIRIKGGLTDFSITGLRSGGTWLGQTTVTQRYGICLENGPSDRYIIYHNIISGNALGPLYDGGTGVTKSVGGNV